MVQTIEQGDIFGRIGKGLGEGFGKGASKQIERNQLASGLEKIASNKDLSEVQRYGQLLRLPGGEEHAATLIPALQRSQAWKGIDETSPVAENVPEKISKENGSEKSSIISPDFEIESALQGLKQEPSQQDINALAKQYHSQGRFIDLGEAQKAAKEELKTNLGAQDTKLSNFETSLNQEAQRLLQSAGLNDYSKSIGEATQKLIRQGKYNILKNGSSPEAESKRFSDSLLDLSKAVTQTKKTGVSAGSFIPGSGKNFKSRVADLKAQKKEFEKYGFEEIYDDVASAAAGITPMQAASVLDPNSNKNFEKQVLKEGKNKVFHGITSRLGDKELNKLVDTIRPEDNLLSLEYLLRENRISIPEFKEKLLEPQNYKKLTDKQKRQLAKESKNSIMDDILFRVF